MVQEMKGTVPAEEKQADAMDKISTLLERALPRDVKEFVDKYVANMESQFVDQVAAVSESGKDEVAVLDISTATLSTTDAIPGFIEEEMPGVVTKEGLPKVKRWKLVVNHIPVTDPVYAVATGVPLEEYVAEAAKKSKGMLDGHSEVASVMLRTGETT